MTDLETKLTADVKTLREALTGLMAWHLAADCYARIGFKKDAPVRAHKDAVAALVATK